MPKGFDPHCRELADLFLPPGTPKAVSDELAQVIQDAIEHHLDGIAVAGAMSIPVADEDSRTRQDERFIRAVDGVPHVTVFTNDPKVTVKR